MEGSATTGTEKNTKFPLLAKAMGENGADSVSDTQQGASSGGAGSQEQNQGNQSGQQQAQQQQSGQQAGGENGNGGNADQGSQQQQNNQGADAGQQQQAAATGIDDMDDAAALDAFNKRFKTNFKSADELLPPKVKTKEELDAEKADRRRKAVEHSLATGKIKLDEYDRAIQAKGKSSRDLALDVFAADMKKINPDIDEAEINERFKDHYREDLKEDDPLRVLRTKEMERVAQGYMKSAFSNVDSIDADYDSYETTQQRLETYGGQIKNVIETLPKELSVKVPYTNVDGKVEEIEYKVAVPENILKAVRKDFLSAEMYTAFGADKNNIKDKVYAEEMLASIRLKSYDVVLKSVLEQHTAEVEKRVISRLKNIPATQPINLGAEAQHHTRDNAPEKPKYSLLRGAQDRADGKK